MEEREKEISRFTRSLRRKAESTRYNYLLDVNQFLDWIEETNSGYIFEEDDLEFDDYEDVFDDYKDYLHGKYESMKTVNRKYNAVNAFLEYKKIDYRIKSEKIQNQTFIDDMLSNEDIKMVINLAEKKNDLRTRAILYTCFYTGARISEVLQLKVSHLGKDEFSVKGKGSVYRRVLICSDLSKILQEYYDSGKRKNDFHGKEVDNLFTSQRGALTRTAVNKSFDKYSKELGYNLKERLHPHAIRHLFTQNLMKGKNVSYSAIKQLLGHSLTTTDIYGQLSKSDLLDILNSMNSLLED